MRDFDRWIVDVQSHMDDFEWEWSKVAEKLRADLARTPDPQPRIELVSDTEYKRRVGGPLAEGER